jgi:hypothetical protein
MQTTLFGIPIAKTKLEAEFEKFHSENPRVYELFRQFALEAICKRHVHYSADAIMHRVRWETSISTTDNEFKINNNHVAFYARMFMDENPEHDGFFETRHRKTEGQN